MRVSTKARYALSAMADLAFVLQDEQLRSVPLSEIADRQELPLPYLEQIFMKLRQANLVQSIRGASGGYFISRANHTIRISDIIYAVDKPARTTRCDPETMKGCLSDGRRCLTHTMWEGLGHVIHQYFKSMTLQDLLNDASPFAQPACYEVRESHVF